MAKTEVNFKQLARDTDISYSTLMKWRGSRCQLIDYLIEAMKAKTDKLAMQSDIDSLNAKIANIHKFTSR